MGPKPETPGGLTGDEPREWDTGDAWSLVEVAAELYYAHGTLPRDLAQLTDAQIAHVLWHPRDRDGKLIRQQRTDPKRPQAGRFPPAEELGVGAEALAIAGARGMTVEYVLMWFQVWRRRGLSAAETLERLRKYQG